MRQGFGVRPPTPEDAALLVRDVRECDREEWVLASGRPLYPCLYDALEQATGPVRTMHLWDHPLCIWGANRTPTPGTGLAWLIGTNLGQRHVRQVQRHFWLGLQELHAAFPRLDAWAYDQNHLHHHWMERLGFARTGDERRMGLGARFILFRREA